MSEEQIIAVQDSLLLWYKKNRREFSWRKKIRDPYEVLVCEVMGQQTQASRIQEFLPRFLKRFPNIHSLAAATKSDVIKQWQGLGYNRRALNLQRTAIALTNRPFPKTEEELLTLPGIGKYTARAILIFAFNKRIAAIDVNIERVLSRIFKRMTSLDSIIPKDKIYPLAEKVLPIRNSRQWHEALMDFGATICTKRNPKCNECPISAQCKSHGKFKINNSLPSQYSEKQYFGYPKRIWRGKVLKIIASSPATEITILNTLQISFPQEDFRSFMKSVLTELIQEGFCEKNTRTYRLHQE
jgi:A/G-specific adenine glycosylase